MLRSSIARKIIRVRSARLLSRSFHDYDVTSPETAPSNTSQSSLPSASGLSSAFPLYKPPTRPIEIPLTQETLDALPTNEEIARELKERVTQKALEGLPSLTEEDLRNFYGNVVRSGLETDQNILRGIVAPERPLIERLEKQERMALILKIEERLALAEPSGEKKPPRIESLSRARNYSIPRRYRVLGALHQLAFTEGFSGPSETSKARGREDVAPEEAGEGQEILEGTGGLEGEGRVDVSEAAEATIAAGAEEHMEGWGNVETVEGAKDVGAAESAESAQGVEGAESSEGVAGAENSKSTERAEEGEIVGEEDDAVVDVQLGILTQKEWTALFQEFLERDECTAAEKVIEVMNAHGVPVDAEQITEIISAHAQAGRTSDVARLSADLAQSGGILSPVHQDLIISSLMRATPGDVRPAIKHLRAAESAGRPFPQSSYNLVLNRLTKPSPTTQPDAGTRAMAWDLFAHMRFAAHPTPTKEVYATMIRVCGEAAQPEPERARDLWIEMTQSEGIDPSRDEYHAIIYALGSTKKTYLEAFDLMRQLLARHDDATTVPFEEEEVPRFSRFVPLLDTFTALLEGTKRAGDLNRARWVLTEVVKLSQTGQALGATGWEMGPKEDLLAAMFMTYAAWNPVLKRGGVKAKEPAASEPGKAKVSAARNQWLDVDVFEDLVDAWSSISKPEDNAVTPADHNADTIHPLTSADALREASGLFHRILDDLHVVELGHTHFLPFRDVTLTPRLINAYLSVHLAHAPSLASAKQEFDLAWTRVRRLRPEIRPNGWTYLQILEKCSAGNRGGVSSPEDRAIAAEWGMQAWREYLLWEQQSAQKEIERIPASSTQERLRRKWLLGIGNRQIERIWRAAIKLHATRGSLNYAFQLVERFCKLYPPKAIEQAYAPLPDMGFVVRLSTSSSTAEANVPPLLLFTDVTALHQALVIQQRFNKAVEDKGGGADKEGGGLKKDTIGWDELTAIEEGADREVDEEGADEAVDEEWEAQEEGAALADAEKEAPIGWEAEGGQPRRSWKDRLVQADSNAIEEEADGMEEVNAEAKVEGSGGNGADRRRGAKAEGESDGHTSR